VNIRPNIPERYDVDNLTHAITEDEVEAVQFERPDAHKRHLSLQLGKEWHDKAEHLYFTCEAIPPNLVNMTCRWEDQDDEDELSELVKNEPGDTIPNAVKTLIQRVWEERNPK